MVVAVESMALAMAVAVLLRQLDPLQSVCQRRRERVGHHAACGATVCETANPQSAVQSSKARNENGRPAPGWAGRGGRRAPDTGAPAAHYCFLAGRPCRPNGGHPSRLGRAPARRAGRKGNGGLMPGSGPFCSGQLLLLRELGRSARRGVRGSA